MTKTEAEWKQVLNPNPFQILRKHATEPLARAPNGAPKGVFYCAGCDLPLFSSDKKFESAPAGELWEPLPGLSARPKIEAT